MDARERANQLIAAFGKMLTLDGLCLEPEHDSCVLLFDEDIVLNIEFDPPEERFLFYVYLDELPEENAEAVLRELMGANLFWMRTGGATLALEEGTNGILLMFAHPVDRLDDALFETLTQNFVQQAENWKKRIAALKEQANGAEEESPVKPGASAPVIYG